MDDSGILDGHQSQDGVRPCSYRRHAFLRLLVVPRKETQASEQSKPSLSVARTYRYPRTTYSMRPSRFWMPFSYLFHYSVSTRDLDGYWGPNENFVLVSAESSSNLESDSE